MKDSEEPVSPVVCGCGGKSATPRWRHSTEDRAHARDACLRVEEREGRR